MKTNRDISRERFVTLTVSGRCNLSCVYCYEDHKHQNEMSFATAKDILDFEMKRQDVDIVHLSLFGGEPFYNFPLICAVVDYLDSFYGAPKVVTNITTNGTLVHGDIQEWLLGRKNDVVCSLSLDGNRTMHNLNRDGSFDSIDLSFFADNYPHQPIKMTITPETLPYLCEGIIFCHERGFRVFCNLAYGINWSNNENVGMLKKQLYDLTQYYLEHPDIEPCSLLSDSFSQIAYDYSDNNAKMWCSAGTKMVAYDTDGTRYPCQMFMPISCGEEKARLASGLQIEEVIPDALLDEKCRQCVIKHACPTCYGSNFIETGNLYRKPDSYCRLIKTVILARSYLMANKWQSGEISLPKREEAALLKAITIVQKSFADERY